jgi:NAD(P)-dependent dehydrogenase (short-subunit alcohol dehydrogenase family)
MGAFDGKIAIITGTAQGIGKATLERFAREGAKVVAADIKDPQGQAAVSAVCAAGGDAIYVHCDVAIAADVDALVRTTVETYGGVDVLVSNAAYVTYTLLVDTSEEEWDRVININLRSAYLLSRRCMPIMAQRGGGSIVLLSSVHARITAATVTPYVASKGGIVSLTRCLALEAAPHQIRVNCILPGAIATPMLLENWGDVPEEQHPLVPRIPMRRIGKPDEIARVCQFLATDESSYMTGTELLVDGGLAAHFD